MNHDINLDSIFEKTKLSYEDQKQLTKNLLKFLEKFEQEKNKEFGKYILELLKEYSEIIPDKSELNFFFEDIEREFKIDMNKLEKEF